MVSGANARTCIFIPTKINSNCFDRGNCESGLEINFFNWEPAGDEQKNFGLQIINFGCQLILYIQYITQEHDFICYFTCKESHN